ncbi:UAA transporter [Coprinellus micaceus]|uniref:UAA transporter n=1 Tax=Coprinellus micaceus TaxID=71717 RepID=A0A4Y7SLH4_COPMI|nr:UAA transporter [Coprinellus micaceus]
MTSANRRKNRVTGTTKEGQRTAPNGTAGVGSGRLGEKGEKLKTAGHLATLIDFSSVISLVLGGCCSNVMTYEKLLLLNPSIGSALTFSQMLFISLQTMPSFITFLPKSFFPALKPRQVPLNMWAIQVVVLTTGSLLNNWAYAYKVPLTVLIVFRSAGLPVSMLFGFLFSQRRYDWKQIVSVLIVTAGAFLSALSKTASSSAGSSLTAAQDFKLYLTGITMLVGSLLCTGVLGVLQERTYKTYGPCWKECLFYTHTLGLPSVVFLGSDVKQGFAALTAQSYSSSPVPFLPYVVLFANLCSQYVCVSGVNQLSSRVTSVSTNIVLTVRKALSLCLSVWWFGNDWNAQLAVGAGMVFTGSLLYTAATNSSSNGPSSVSKKLKQT